MTDMSKDELLDFRMTSIIRDAEERMFHKFDDLHKQGHNDDDIIHYLRRQGYTGYADQYIEWADCVDPDREGGDESDAVPDPGDAHSYTDLGKLLARSSINAYLRSDEINTSGAIEKNLQRLRNHLPKGTIVAYWPDGDYRSKVWTEAVTSCEVFVAAGTPVVSLASGRQAVPLSHLQVIG